MNVMAKILGYLMITLGVVLLFNTISGIFDFVLFDSGGLISGLIISICSIAFGLILVMMKKH